MKKLFAAVLTAVMSLSMTACAMGGDAAAATNADGTQAAGGLGGITFWIVYIVIIGAFVYFMMIRPNKKQKKEKAELYASMAVGDSVLTTSGFYGVIIDLTDDTVIVEFGNNKNCRIPMQREAIVQVEKPDYTVTAPEEKKD